MFVLPLELWLQLIPPEETKQQKIGMKMETIFKQTFFLQQLCSEMIIMVKI